MLSLEFAKKESEFQPHQDTIFPRLIFQLVLLNGLVIVVIMHAAVAHNTYSVYMHAALNQPDSYYYCWSGLFDAWHQEI